MAGSRIENYEYPRIRDLSYFRAATIEDNDLTRSFEAKLRKSSLESMLLRYLARRAEREPLVIVLEDCHWLDALSADLLDEVARVAAALAVLLVVTLATQRWWLIGVAFLEAYGFAWVGHFFFEKNRPATFKYPIFSFIGDWRLWWDILMQKQRIR